MPETRPRRVLHQPVVIEAMEFTEQSAQAVIGWCGAVPFPAGENWDTGEPEAGYLAIQTLEGVMRADLGDWIVRGVKGEFYPVKPDIFEATYEVVQSDRG